MECKYSYRFTEKAEQDFDEILRYISVDLANPAAAQSLGRKMFEQMDVVRAFPDSGVLVDNEFLSDKSVRKLLVDHYIMYYKVHYDEKLISVIEGGDITLYRPQEEIFTEHFTGEQVTIGPNGTIVHFEPQTTKMYRKL